MNPFGSAPSRPPSGRTPNRDRALFLAIGTMLLAVVLLIPAYALTPAHELIGRLLAGPVAAGKAPRRPAPTPGTTVVPPLTVQPLTPTPPTPTVLATPVGLATAAAGDQRVAFLLLGYGGGNHDGAYLTDSMMVVIADPTHKTLTLLSIPRDTWVPLFFDGATPVYDKINTAYAYAMDPTLYPDRLPRYAGKQGAGTFAMDTVSRLLGIPITYYVALDFTGFREMIDAVGGIDVDVPDSFTARYPANDDPTINPGWITVHFSAGLQHMNGERAIEYARARETLDNPSEGSDFARSRRQRQIMEAFKERLLQPGGLVALPRLLLIAAQHMDTNYPIPAAAAMSQLIFQWHAVTFFQAALTTDNYLEEATGPDGLYALVPNAPDHSWRQIRAFARRLWSDPPAATAMADTRIVIQNGSGTADLGERLAAALIALGYRTGDPVAIEPRPTSRLIDETGGKASALIPRLTADLGLENALTVEPSDAVTGELILQLGMDAAGLAPLVPIDAEAPTSAVGIRRFGLWAPLIDTPTPRPAPRTFATPTPTGSPTGEGTPEPTGETASSPTTTPAPRGAERLLPPPRATPITVPGQPNLVVVPNLIGRPEDEAQQIITESGLMTTYVNYQTAADVPDRRYFESIAPGAVLSQIPRPGERVPRGTRVYLAVRKP